MSLERAVKLWLKRKDTRIIYGIDEPHGPRPVVRGTGDLVGAKRFDRWLTKYEKKRLAEQEALFALEDVARILLNMPEPDTEARNENGH